MAVIAITAMTIIGMADEVDGGDRKSAYDSIWGRVVLYDDSRNNALKKFAFTGRLQGDYYNFDDSDWGSESDFNWRRFRLASRLLFLKASLFIRKRI